MQQLLLHLVGDYLLQSEHMGVKKRTSTFWASIHATVYALPFLLLQPSWLAWTTICGTHLIIDRFGLARHLVWAKNIVLGLWPERVLCWCLRDAGRLEEWRTDRRRLAWKNCAATGYPNDMPSWLAPTLLIVADNTLHLVINWCSLTWL